MTKADIAQRIAADLGITRLEAKAVVDAFLGIVTQALGDGERVELRGFGTFSSVARAPRMGRNPRTQEPVPVPARRTATFKPIRQLRVMPPLGTSPPG